MNFLILGIFLCLCVFLVPRWHLAHRKDSVNICQVARSGVNIHSHSSLTFLDLVLNLSTRGEIHALHVRMPFNTASACEPNMVPCTHAVAAVLPPGALLAAVLLVSRTALGGMNYHSVTQRLAHQKEAKGPFGSEISPRFHLSRSGEQVYPFRFAGKTALVSPLCAVVREEKGAVTGCHRGASPEEVTWFSGHAEL